MVRFGTGNTGCTIKDITGVGSNTANNFVDCISIGGQAHDHTLLNVRLTTSKKLAVTNFLNFEGPTSNSTIGGFYAVGSVATAGISDAANATVKNADWRDIRIAVGGVTKPAAVLDATAGSGGLAANGIITGCYFAGTDATIANNAAFTGDWRKSQVYVSEETGGIAQGALIPAVDAD
jgi:hypothetical protein